MDIQKFMKETLYAGVGERELVLNAEAHEALAGVEIKREFLLDERWFVYVSVAVHQALMEESFEGESNSEAIIRIAKKWFLPNILNVPMKRVALTLAACRALRVEPLMIVKGRHDRNLAERIDDALWWADIPMSLFLNLQSSRKRGDSLIQAIMETKLPEEDVELIATDAVTKFRTVSDYDLTRFLLAHLHPAKLSQAFELIRAQGVRIVE